MWENQFKIQWTKEKRFQHCLHRDVQTSQKTSKQQLFECKLHYVCYILRWADQAWYWYIRILFSQSVQVWEYWAENEYIRQQNLCFLMQWPFYWPCERDICPGPWPSDRPPLWPELFGSGLDDRAGVFLAICLLGSSSPSSFNFCLTLFWISSSRLSSSSLDGFSSGIRAPVWTFVIQAFSKSRGIGRDLGTFLRGCISSWLALRYFSSLSQSKPGMAAVSAESDVFSWLSAVK